MRREKRYIRFWWGNIKEGDHMEDLGVDGTSLEWVLKESIRRASTELMWLKIGTDGGLL
jgi:hypothetical protein